MFRHLRVFVKYSVAGAALRLIQPTRFDFQQAVNVVPTNLV